MKIAFWAENILLFTRKTVKFLMKARLFLTHKVNQFLKHYSQTNVPEEELVNLGKFLQITGPRTEEE